MSKYKVAIVTGGLSEGSMSNKLGAIFNSKFSDEFEGKFVSVADLALYNPDLETDTPPEAWTVFRNEIKEADAVLFVTSEYNRTMPASLKNAIDVGSQPGPENVWNKKPGAVVSIGAGTIGGFGAAHHLRQAVVYLNMHLMQAPEAYIGNIYSLMDAEGNIVSEGTEEFIQMVTDSFEDWVKIFK